jgi:hypothetical protein
LAEVFEQSLAAIFDPSVFRRAAARPAPSAGAAAGLALAAGAAALAVDLAHAAISSPGLLQRFSPLVLGAVAVAALGLYGSLLLLFAVMLYGIGNGFGGKGDFERGLQAAAMISVLAPLQMLCNWFPAAWLVPALLAAWVAAGALENLFNARRVPARALCALLAAGAIGLQVGGRMLADRARAVYAATQALKETSEASADLARSMSAFTQQAQALSATASPASAPPAASGLDLLRVGPSPGDAAPAPGEQASAAPPPRPLGGAPQGTLPPAVQAMQTNTAGMLDALTPMLDTLARAKEMGPVQKADIGELQGLMQDLKTQMISGKRMDNAVFAQRMARYQTLMMKVMSYSAQPQPSAPAAPTAAPDPNVRLKFPQDGR